MGPEILAALRADLGPRVALAAADPRLDPPAPWAGEEAGARAVAKRRREHAWGRALARDALSELGGPQVALPRRPAPDRRPMWPPGFTGSITHCDDMCAALVARTEDWTGVGLDVEPSGPLEAEAWAVVMTPRERSQQGVDGARAKRFFVAKEAYYKAQYQRTEQLLDFVDVELELEGDHVRATCRANGLPPLDGRVFTLHAHVWSWFRLPANF